MNYNSLIRNWHIKASEEDYFSKFVFEYLSFIAFLKKKKYIESLKDREAIQSLKRDHSIKTKYLEKIKSKQSLKRSWEKITSELVRSRLGDTSSNSEEVEEVKWWNCSHQNLHRQTEEEKRKIKGKIHNLDDWDNMVEYWSTIRNNLFHGSKDPQDKRDRILVENGYKTLRELVEILLSEEQS